MGYYNDNDKDYVENDVVDDDRQPSRRINLRKEPETVTPKETTTYDDTYVETPPTDTYRPKLRKEEYYEEPETTTDSEYYTDNTLDNDTYVEETTPTPPRYTTIDPPVQRDNKHAITSLVCGILSIVCCTGCIGIVASILAIVFYNMDKKNNNNIASPMATAGLACGIIGIIFSILVLVFSFAIGLMEQIA